MKRLLIPLLPLLMAAGTPWGPPAGYRGDPIPTPTRTIYVDRCGRGAIGTCGSVTCSHTSAGTGINTPICNLNDLWNGFVNLQPGDQINVRPGNPAASDVTKNMYGEVDTHLGAQGTFNANATLNPTVKGTSVCSGGVNNGWDCRAGLEATDCPGGTCVYKPIVLACQTEGGVQAQINPTFIGGVLATGGTTCSGVPGRYIGINFDNPACNNVSNERMMCWGGTTWGKPCATTGDCGTGVASCAARPWNWIIDGCEFTGWYDYDSRGTSNNATHYCAMQPIQMSAFHSCTAGDKGGQFATIQNNYIHHNYGDGIIQTYSGGAGFRIFHNEVGFNRTHGYTTAVNLFALNDNALGVTTYLWGNYIHDSAETAPPWCNPRRCTGTPSPALTCSADSPPAVAGTSCLFENDCQGGHCGPECSLVDQGFGASNPQNQGQNCYCNVTADCSPGLTCNANAGDGGCTPTNTEGKNADIDTAHTTANADIRNNIFTNGSGDGFIANSTDNVVVANNTFWHNAKKGAGGSPYGDLQLEGNNLRVFNNLVVPDPNNGSCYEGSNGGKHCTLPNNGTECPGGTVCVMPGMFMAETYALWAITPSTNQADYNGYWFNLAGWLTDPPIFGNMGFAFNTPLHTFSQWQTHPGVRDQHGKVADPQFLSTTPGSPYSTTFLHVATASPMGFAGTSTWAPTFDMNNRPRPNPPGIGALEPDSGGVTTSSTSSTTTTTTSTTTTSTIAGGFPVSDLFNRPGPSLGANWVTPYTTNGQAGTVQIASSSAAQNNSVSNAGIAEWTPNAYTANTQYACTAITGNAQAGIAGPCLISGTNMACCFLLQGDPNVQVTFNTFSGTTETDWVNGQAIATAQTYVGITRTGATTFHCFTSDGTSAWTDIGTAATPASFAANGNPGLVVGYGFGGASYKSIDSWEAGTGTTLPSPPSACGSPAGGTTTTSTTTTTTTTTGAGTTTTTTPGGFAPPSWTNDATVIAWWPFDADVNNHSTNTAYCNPASDANLQLFHGGDGIYGTIRIDTANKRIGPASFQWDGNTTLAQPNTVGPDCLRTAQPNAWTYTFWGRVTAQNTGSCTPFPYFLFNRDEACSIPSQCFVGSYVIYDGSGSVNNGRTYACTHNPTDAPNGSGDFCVYANGNGGNTYFNNDSTWHFGAMTYDGTNLKYSIDGFNTPGFGAHALGKNPGTYPFQISHDSNINCFAGIIGNQDDVFWTSKVLAVNEICRLMSCGADGSRCWCSGTSLYNPCATDADCGGRAGACNTAYPSGGKAGTCVGLLKPASAGGLTGCTLVSDLASCTAVLTGATTTTTTLTPTTTTTTTSTTTTTTLGAGKFRQQGSGRRGHRWQ